MHSFLNSSFKIGSLELPNRLIQGPLAGYSCAPFRELLYQFIPPAYSVSEMLSSQDIISKHDPQSRYLARSPKEKITAYQLSGHDPVLITKAAVKLEALGADIIDFNCGCPKTKIRKKGAGSALLEKPQRLIQILETLRQSISIPITVKIRIQKNEQDILLAQAIAKAGADALIVHGRHWKEDYDSVCNFKHIGKIKQAVGIPVIANGDISNLESLKIAHIESNCDAYMISRAGCGQPWLFEELLTGEKREVLLEEKITLFVTHLRGLSALESEKTAILQSRSLVRYYFRELLNEEFFRRFIQSDSLIKIEEFLYRIPKT